MVRLEKIAYQKIVNSAALGRNRVLSTAQKWNSTNPYHHSRKLAHVFLNSWLGTILRPLIQAYTNIELNTSRDIMLQQGLTPQDTFLHRDSQLRRNILFEHIARSNLHPYHWVLKMRRRERYFKVNHQMFGFHVPEYLRKEASTQTYADLRRLKSEWSDFVHDNYYSDITPSAHRSVIPKWNVIQLLMNYGILRPEAYNRYFFNETDDAWYSKKQIEGTKDRKKFPYDLTTAQGKRRFEDYVNTVNSKTPGVVAPEGQEFDFKKYYAEIGV